MPLKSVCTFLGIIPTSPQTMTPQQRAQYLPVMKALLKVMETGNLTTFSVSPNFNNLAPNLNN